VLELRLDFALRQFFLRPLGLVSDLPPELVLLGSQLLLAHGLSLPPTLQHPQMRFREPELRRLPPMQCFRLWLALEMKLP
jgi:hypothetical protein